MTLIRKYEYDNGQQSIILDDDSLDPKNGHQLSIRFANKLKCYRLNAKKAKKLFYHFAKDSGLDCWIVANIMYGSQGI